MSESPETPIVRNNRLRERFEIEVDGHTAYAKYHQAGDRITFIHTIVPPELEGRGIGSQIARTALEAARDKQWRVIPRCPFIKAYIERHPEYQDLVA